MVFTRPEQQGHLGWRFVNPAMRFAHGVDSLPETAENVSRQFAISRADQDALAPRSQQRWARAHEHGFCLCRAGPAVTRDLGLPDDAAHVNPKGGAIAIGHSLGASGARRVMTLLRRREASGGCYGLATMCIGVGQGLALVIERLR